MQRYISVVAVVLCVGLSGCSDSPSSQDESDGESDIQPGSYYSFASRQGDCKVLKVLAVEADVIHFCHYNNVFEDRPTDEVIASLFFGKIENMGVLLDVTDNRQTAGCKHTALERAGWGYLKPKYLSGGQLHPDELEAYEEWKKGDRTIFPAGTRIGN